MLYSGALHVVLDLLYSHLFPALMPTGPGTMRPAGEFKGKMSIPAPAGQDSILQLIMKKPTLA